MKLVKILWILLALVGLGFNKYKKGDFLEEVLPLYLKKPQAQRLLEEKLNADK